jgi:hypothetical protein
VKHYALPGMHAGTKAKLVLMIYLGILADLFFFSSVRQSGPQYHSD